MGAAPDEEVSMENSEIDIQEEVAGRDLLEILTHFPYTTMDENIYETLHRLLHFVQTAPRPNEVVLNLFNWLAQVVERTHPALNNVFRAVVMRDRLFWAELPELFAPIVRKSVNLYRLFLVGFG